MHTVDVKRGGDFCIELQNKIQVIYVFFSFLVCFALRPDVGNMKRGKTIKL